jgi:hypothetical protein
MIRINKSALRQTSWRQGLLRFGIGGLITVAAGVIAKTWGPVFGGLFLAFPAIFPATLTLVAKHEQDKKREQGLDGSRRGIQAAAVDAAGAALGSAGLAAFAAANWWLLGARLVPLAFTVSTAAWFCAAFFAWTLWKKSWLRR